MRIDLGFEIDDEDRIDYEKQKTAYLLKKRKIKKATHQG